MKDLYYLFRNKKQVVKHVEGFRTPNFKLQIKNEGVAQRIEQIKKEILHSLPDYENIEHFILSGTSKYISVFFVYKDKPSCEHYITINVIDEFSNVASNTVSIVYTISDITYSYLNEDRAAYLKMVENSFFTRIKRNFFRNKIECRFISKGYENKKTSIKSMFSTLHVHLFYKLFFFAHKKTIKEITKLFDLKKSKELFNNVSPSSWGFNTIYKTQTTKQNLDDVLDSKNKTIDLLMESYRLLLMKNTCYDKIRSKDILSLFERYNDHIFFKTESGYFEEFNQNNFDEIIDVIKFSDGYNEDSKDLLDLRYLS